jgi:signal transduction histidine kinase
VIASCATIDELRALSLFEGLPDDALEWMLANGEVRSYAPNETVLEPNSPATHMYVLLEGTVHVHVLNNGQVLNAATYHKGSATGVLPYSRMTTIPAKVFVSEPTRVLLMPRERLAEMLSHSPELGQRLVTGMVDRVREQTKNQQQREKMMALGKLSAGLAHELNNPAAAIKRSAEALRNRFHVLKSAIAPLITSPLTQEQFEAVKRMRQAAMDREPPPELSPVERGRREDQIGDWLEDHGVAQAWTLAATYVEIGITTADLEAWAKELSPETLPHVLTWLEASVSAECFLEEIEHATGRISELVKSVKQYSHMDAMPDRQPVDVRQGLDSTLTMLGHEIKAHHVKVEKDYAPDLPLVSAYPGELNQVWTNLLDNAIDAVPQQGGKVRVEAFREDGIVTVRVIDNGSGIAPETQTRIFEPFFTTKPVGEGTGLGLDIAQRIVSQHGGRITVESKPGETIFSVLLPLS